MTGLHVYIVNSIFSPGVHEAYLQTRCNDQLWTFLDRIGAK